MSYTFNTLAEWMDGQLNTLRMMTLAAMALAGSQFASAGAIIDQQNTFTNSYFGPSSAPGQSFTPSLNGIDFATFSLATTGASSTLVVNLFSGAGYGGTLLGTTSQMLITNAYPDFETVQFNFSSTVALTAGSLYTLQLDLVGGSDIYEQESASNSYSAGDEYGSVGDVQTGYDLVFSEGINSSVPEPSTYVLLGSGAILLIGFKRLRGQRSQL
jgi:hypothetical protein